MITQLRYFRNDIRVRNEHLPTIARMTAECLNA